MFAPWPHVDEAALVKSSVLVVVQVNGKVRSKITVPTSANEEQVAEIAYADENVQKFVDGKTIRKQIYVPNKLFNIVAN